MADKKDEKVAGAGGAAPKEQEDPRKSMNYALTKSVDMNLEVKAEASETIVTALEKFPHNYEQAARMVKELMDKKYGPTWHCVVGEGYGFDVTYEVSNMIYLYFGGNVAVLLFKV
eukprot:tig00000042_g15500.t1